MYFYWDYKFDNFLFENLNIDTLAKCLIIIGIVFLLAFLNEGIKHVQKVIKNKLELNLPEIIRENDVINTEQTPLTGSLRILSNEEIKKRKFYNHVIQSIMYMINLTIGYILMNISMYYYAGHFLAIILGFTFGYYILNVASPETDHCANVDSDKSCHAAENTDSNRAGTSRSLNSNLNYDEI